MKRIIFLTLLPLLRQFQHGRMKRDGVNGGFVEIWNTLLRFMSNYSFLERKVFGGDGCHGRRDRRFLFHSPLFRGGGVNYGYLVVP